MIVLHLMAALIAALIFMSMLAITKADRDSVKVRVRIL